MCQQPVHSRCSLNSSNYYSCSQVSVCGTQVEKLFGDNLKVQAWVCRVGFSKPNKLLHRPRNLSHTVSDVVVPSVVC